MGFAVVLRLWLFQYGGSSMEQENLGHEKSSINV